MRPLNYFKTRPKVPPIDVHSYLKRLGLDHDRPSLAYLKKLHRAHLLQIPFENLDIHYGRRITLDIRPIFKKIILDHRGGFCFELNSLFFHLLNHLGFEADLGSARVFKDGELSPEFDHMILFVRIGEQVYLADVGFGDLFSQPKLVEPNKPQLDFTEYFKFELNADGHFLLKRSSTGSDYRTVYQFQLAQRELIEFLSRCNFHQDSMDSPFKNTKLISRLFPEGRITLTDRMLKKKWGGEIIENPIMNEDEFLTKVEEHFGITSSQLLRQLSDQ